MEQLLTILPFFGMALAIMIVVPMVIYALILFDSVATKAWFFKGISVNRLVILLTLGGHFVRCLARVEKYHYDPKTGSRTPGKQKKFYKSPFLNHLADFWGVYYKGINCRFFRPSWCGGDYQIPANDFVRDTTDGAEMRGIALSADNLITLEVKNAREYMYLGETKNPFEIIKGDYNSSMRSFISNKGNSVGSGKGSDESFDYQAIFKINTEDLTKGKDFKEGPLEDLRKSADKYGLYVPNIAIEKIYPTTEEDRQMLAKEAKAEIDRRAKVKDAEGDAESTRINASANAESIEKEGEARVKVEKDLVKVGVTPEHRRAMAYERMPGLTHLVEGFGIPFPGTGNSANKNSDLGDVSKKKPEKEEKK